MDVISRTRQVIKVLERSYREAENANRRPRRAGVGEVPEPTDVDAHAARLAAAELTALGVTTHSWENWLRISWFPYLRQFPGFDRRIGEGGKSTITWRDFPSTAMSAGYSSRPDSTSTENCSD